MPVTVTDRLFGENSSVAVKAPCVAVATANIVLSGLQTINGYQTKSGDRILVTGQTDATQNGIYNASTAAWTRSGDFDGNNDVAQGTLVIVLQGVVGLFYQLTTANPTIGTTALTLVQVWQPPNVTYPQTTAEQLAGVVPVNTAYLPGNLLRYGADSTGVIAADTAIQNAINSAPAGGEVVIPDGTYKIAAGVTVTNKNHLRIHGKGVLDTSSAPSGAFCIQLVGTCDDVTFEGFTIQGPTNAAYTQTGIGMFGGQTLSRIRYLNLKVDGVNVGLSFNAVNSTPAPSGSVTYSEIRGCVVSNIRGTNSGQGYGIHLANPQYCIIANNIVDNASRHSIYHAWGGDNTIIGNIASNHRLTENDGGQRCSFIISRSQRVLFVGNKDINGHDGSLEISPDSSTAQNCSEISVIGCEFSQPQNNAYPVFIGEQQVPTAYRVMNVLLSGNRFDSDYGKLANAHIIILNGQGITIQGNDFHVTNVTGTARGVSDGDSSYIGATADCTEVTIRHNRFRFEGSNLTDVRCIDLDSTICGNAAVHFLGPNTYSGVSNEVSLQAALTNTNVAIETPPLDGSATYDAPSLAAGAGTTTTVTVTGASIGDFVHVSFSGDISGLTVTAYVSAANTVSVRLQNGTAGTIDLASMTLRARVFRRLA